ncbi:hypothetical protein JTB14_020965 [Gonioctena quinquepunctata]|nr:hypothetical protein JTB14_020965 [Gonioctena quinquepunctata]
MGPGGIFLGRRNGAELHLKLKGQENEIFGSSENLLGIVTGKEVPPSNPGANVSTDEKNKFEKSNKDWIDRENKAQEIIVTRLEETPMSSILLAQTSNAMWEKLHAVYEYRSEVNLHLVQQKFYNYKYDEEGIATFLMKIEGMVDQMTKLGTRATKCSKSWTDPVNIEDSQGNCEDEHIPEETNFEAKGSNKTTREIMNTVFMELVLQWSC